MASFPLAKGTSGREVVALQNALNALQDNDGNYLFNLVVTGSMDDPTVNAIKAMSALLVENGNKGLSVPLTAIDYNTIVGDSPDYTTGTDDDSNLEGVFHLDAPPDGYHAVPQYGDGVYENDANGGTWWVTTPIGDFSAPNPNAGQSIFTQLYLAITPWLTAHGYAGSGKVQSLETKFNSKAWGKDPDPMNDVARMNHFLITLIGMGDTYKAGYKKPGVLKEVGKAIGKAAKDIGDIAKKVIDEAAKVLKNIGEDIVFAPLLPFKGAMKKKIAEAGLKDDNTMVDVINKFGQAVGAHHFEGMYNVDTDIPAPEPGIDTTDKNYADLLNEGLNQVTPLVVKPAPPVPQIIVTAVTAAGKIIGLGDATCLSVAQMIWGFLHHEKQTPGTDVHTAIKTLQDAHGHDKKDEDIGATLQIGKFKIKAAVFAPAAIAFVVLILIAVNVFKKKK